MNTITIEAQNNITPDGKRRIIQIFLDGIDITMNCDAIEMGPGLTDACRVRLIVRSPEGRPYRLYQHKIIRPPSSPPITSVRSRGMLHVWKKGRIEVIWGLGEGARPAPVPRIL